MCYCVQESIVSLKDLWPVQQDKLFLYLSNKKKKEKKSFFGGQTAAATATEIVNNVLFWNFLNQI